jgi:hypothetical protein
MDLTLTYKKCISCAEIKHIDLFNYHNKNKGTLRNQCKECRSEYKKNRQKEKSEQIALKKKQYYINNKEKISKYKKDRRAHYNSLENKRRATKLQATFSGYDKEIERFYVLSKHFTEVTGIQHHVDHIEPLQGKNSCGLHVPWNLQVITAEENLRKGNKL